MGQRRYLTNAPYNPHGPRNHTIWIEEGDPEWEAAYARWAGQRTLNEPPTDSPEWKGIYMGFVEIKELRGES